MNTWKAYILLLSYTNNSRRDLKWIETHVVIPTYNSSTGKLEQKNFDVIQAMDYIVSLNPA